MSSTLTTDAGSVAGSEHHLFAALIEAEREWRCFDEREPTQGNGGITVARWTYKGGDAPLKVAHAGNRDCHCIAVNLKSASLKFNYAGLDIVQDRVSAGAVQVTAPHVPVSAVFESSADVLHLFVAQRALAECYEDLFRRCCPGEILLEDPRLIRDPVLDRLAQALAVSHSSDAVLGKVFTDSVGLAIVSRIVAHRFRGPRRCGRDTALPHWRMKRVIEYVDAHLSEPVSLGDIAASAGLTSMHFAAQFRRATGMRPHEYLLRRRIERAQEIMLVNQHGLIDVALRCGFRSQAHFTTVFKRFVGETPHSWRMKRVTR
jgi:AraC-like DNA-binding protein